MTTHSVKITGENWNPEGLHYKWPRPEFTADDGIGPLASLFQVGNAVAAVGGFVGDKIVTMGSGVMVAPGLMLTATHVLKEFPADGEGPVICTFLPNGGARAWLPHETNTCWGPGDFVIFGAPEKRRTSDLSLVSCVLMSEAHAEFPVMLAPLEMDLPLPGERLWAVGFRHGDIDAETAGLAPLVSSGVVTTCFPHGRDQRLPSPCVEVAMPTLGGMSGGPVFNEAGRVVGLVSSSFEGEDHLGPTYVTLAWDALRIGVQAPWPKGVWREGESDLFAGKESGIARIEGDIKRDSDWNVTLNLRSEAIAVVAATAKNLSSPTRG